MPVLPSCIIEPLWDQFAALLPDRVDPHPLGCHRRRIPDRIVFDKLLCVLVFGSGYERIADALLRPDPAPPPRRVDCAWADAAVVAPRPGRLRPHDRSGPVGAGHRRVHHQSTLRRRGRRPQPRRPRQARPQALHDHRRHGHPTWRGASSGQPQRPHPAGRNPGRLGRPGRDGPLPRAAHRAPGPRLRPSGRTRAAGRARPAWPGRPAGRARTDPARSRWVIERTHAWGNTFGKLRWCTERRRRQVEFYLALACAVIVVRALIGRARLLYRWDARPTARRLR
jgi:hypothetical protein